jgi:hypothetical protein
MTCGGRGAADEEAGRGEGMREGGEGRDGEGL